MSWDYKLGLLDVHPITSTIRLFDIEVKSIPFSEFPYWVTEKEWGIVTFVTKNIPGFAEAIYEWDFPGMDYYYYILGLSAREPIFEDLPSGYQGEYSLELNAQPFLYFSTVDRQLHLINSQYGVNNLAEGKKIEYEDVNSDGFIDQWNYFEDDKHDKLLSLLGDYLIFVNLSDQNALIRMVDFPLFQFTTLPPRDNQEWRYLGEKLDKYSNGIEGNDLLEMFQQFSSPITSIDEGLITDLRITDTGFRFILELLPGFSFDSETEDWGSRMTTPGTYVVSFDGRDWEVRPSTPASLQVNKLIVNQPGGAPSAWDWTSIEIWLENDGLEDLHNTSVALILDGPEGQREVLTTSLPLLPAEEGLPVILDWLPPVSGKWHAQVELSDLSGTDNPIFHLLFDLGEIAVEPSPEVTMQWWLTLGGRVRLEFVALFALLGLIAGGLVAIWVLEGKQLQTIPPDVSRTEGRRS